METKTVAIESVAARNARPNLRTEVPAQRKPKNRRTQRIVIKGTAREVEQIAALSSEERQQRVMQAPEINVNLARAALADLEGAAEQHRAARAAARRERYARGEIAVPEDDRTHVGRKRTDAFEARTAWVPVFMSRQDYSTLVDRAHNLGLTLSDYCRIQLTTGVFTDRERHIALNRRIAQLQEAVRFAEYAAR